MPKQKYDWNKIKLDFIKSDFDEVKQFFQDKYKIYNGEIAKNTKGWTKEKIEWKSKIIERALEKQADKDAENLTLDISFLAKAKKNVVKRLIKKLINMDDDLSISEITKGIESIRTEMELPTRYTKNENTNKEEKTDLTEEETEALKIILKKNK